MSSIEKLPAEVLDHILGFFKQKAGLSTVSRQWQALVERHTFSRITVTNNSLEIFDQAFSASNRRRKPHVRMLRYCILVPSLNRDSALQMPGGDSPQPDKQKSQDNVVFTRALMDLFERLSSLNGIIRLTIAAGAIPAHSLR